MRAPSVLIIASPYEGELIGRALSDIGLRVLRADGGEGAHALLATELPIAAVIGTSLVGADPVALVTETKARHERIALFLLSGADDPLLQELRPHATAVFARPVELEALVHAIERLAVEVERADLEDGAEIGLSIPELDLGSRPPPIPRIPTQPLGDAILPGPLVRAHRTEILSDASGSVAALVSPPAGTSRPSEPDTQATRGTAANLLRVDDALGPLAGLALDEVSAPPSRTTRAFDNRSTIAREIDRELSQAERRLFPDQSATPLPFRHLDDYDDALADIDLDSLAIDTVPGLAAGQSALLGVDETRARSPARPREAALAPPPARPVQEEGSLAETDVAELIARLHAAAFSGALYIDRPEGERTLYFDQGEPVGARSTLRHDHLAELLFREGKLNREQVTRLRAGEAAGVGDEGADGSGRRVALRLVDLGLLKESEIFPAVRRHVEELFFSIFALDAGRYRLGPSLPSTEDRVRLPAGGWALTLEGVRRKYGLERLSSLLGGREAVLHPTSFAPRVIEAAGLSTDERRIVALIDGTRTLGELRKALGGYCGTTSAAPTRRCPTRSMSRSTASRAPPRSSATARSRSALAARRSSSRPSSTGLPRTSPPRSSRRSRQARRPRQRSTNMSSGCHSAPTIRSGRGEIGEGRLRRCPDDGLSQKQRPDVGERAGELRHVPHGHGFGPGRP